MKRPGNIDRTRVRHRNNVRYWQRKRGHRCDDAADRTVGMAAMGMATIMRRMIAVIVTSMSVPSMTGHRPGHECAIGHKMPGCWIGARSRQRRNQSIF